MSLTLSAKVLPKDSARLRHIFPWTQGVDVAYVNPTLLTSLGTFPGDHRYYGWLRPTQTDTDDGDLVELWSPVMFADQSDGPHPHSPLQIPKSPVVTTPVKRTSAPTASPGWKHDASDILNLETDDTAVIYLTRCHFNRLFPNTDRASSTVELSLVARARIPCARVLHLEGSLADIQLSGCPQQMPNWLRNRVVRVGITLEYPLTAHRTLRFQVVNVEATFDNNTWFPGQLTGVHSPWVRLMDTTDLRVSPVASATPCIGTVSMPSMVNPEYDHLVGSWGSATARLSQLLTLAEGHVNRVRLPSSILLYGPTGIGKTTLIRELVGWHPALRIRWCDIGELAEHFPGNLVQGLRYQFQPRYARDVGPFVLCLEHLDTMFPPQGSDPHLLVALIQELTTGTRSTSASHVYPSLVIATAQSPQQVHPEVRNAFTDVVGLTVPTGSERRHLFHYWLRNNEGPWPKDASRDDIVHPLVTHTHGFLAADMYSLVQRSCSHWTKAQGVAITEWQALVAEQARYIRPSVLVTPGVESFVPEDLRESGQRLSWQDVGGLVKTKQLLQEAIQWLREYSTAYRRLGITPRRGILLHGPPGTGKTLLARVAAFESGAHFLPVRIPQLVRGEVGESEKAVAQLFRVASQVSPCVVFIDELEALFGTKQESGRWGKGVISQLLLEMDRLQDTDQSVVILAATNHLGRVDASILRAGRLDTLVHVPPPDAAERATILELHCRHKPVCPTVNWSMLASQTAGWTGADLRGLVNSAGLIALGRLQPVGQDAKPNSSWEISPEDFAVALTAFTMRLASSGPDRSQ
ncbi:hypothetical protein IWQ62_002601 [Dispira parvispora]|uniref:AAA+ ATPase domain-containing protein n=1 Tax=Dispira parvispora TaxID=1520584 RepID=A0A9W8AVD5_9FUNG|nr:hypothetical protein IWQ62_002601 [Dispira parvispora]